MTKEDMVLTIIATAVAGFIMGAVLSAALWTNKVYNCEQQIEIYNKEMKYGNDN
jgi:hypothetical protein